MIYLGKRPISIIYLITIDGYMIVMSKNAVLYFQNSKFILKQTTFNFCNI